MDPYLPSPLFWHLLEKHLTDSLRWRVARAVFPMHRSGRASWLRVEPRQLLPTPCPEKTPLSLLWGSMFWNFWDKSGILLRNGCWGILLCIPPSTGLFSFSNCSGWCGGAGCSPNNSEGHFSTFSPLSPTNNWKDMEQQTKRTRIVSHKLPEHY